MNISIIVAIDNNYGIGKDNRLLCHLPNDLKHFKQITKGNTVIMGRNTFLSLPKGALPDRKNIVITDKDESFTQCIMVNSINEALKHCDAEKENFVIGGASIYKQFFSIANQLYITKIHHSFDADTFFPLIIETEWKETGKQPNYKDEKHLFDYTFINYVRI